MHEPVAFAFSLCAMHHFARHAPRRGALATAGALALLAMSHTPSVTVLLWIMMQIVAAMAITLWNAYR